MISKVSEVSTIYCVMLSISLAIFCVWVNGPNISKIILILDASNAVMSKLKCINVMIENQENHNFVIKECLFVSKRGLRSLNETFSNDFLAISILTVLGITAESYTAISYCFRETVFKDLQESCMFLSLLAYVTAFGMVLATLNNWSEKVLNEVKFLKEKMVEIDKDVTYKELKENGTIINYDKTDVIQVLDSFKGFDCCGYFTMGNPLLASIMATFATYSIILIQFKMA